MEALAPAGLVFGMMGFIFALNALGQISKLAKRIEKLEGPAQ